MIEFVLGVIFGMITGVWFYEWLMWKYDKRGVRMEYEEREGAGSL